VRALRLGACGAVEATAADAQALGDGNGRFRTGGRHSAAIVTGTRWLVQDSCAGTLTRVTRGRVRVTDFRRGRTVTVRAGGRYVAR